MKLRVDYCSKWLLVVLILTLGSFAYAQRSISGKVTDEASGDPLIGANILVVGTSTGTATDIDGGYTLNVPAGATELEISYTGYTTKRVAIGTGDVQDITLAAGQALDEVVVVGYGTVRKRDATGAVTSVKPEDFNQGVISSPEQLLQGRAAGVQITNNSGEPGGGVNVRIRGTSSVRSNNNPLFVVDGIPLDGGATSASADIAGLGSAAARNPLSFINPDDIESIDILKDASAAAIYGSRGANGVVLITTKKGKAGQKSLSFSASGSVSSIANKLDLLDSGNYVAAASAAGANAQLANFGGSTDWQDEIFRTAFTQNYSLAYGGGNDDTRYRFSLGYMDQQGIIENSGLKRLNGRINATHELFKDRLTLGIQMTVTQLEDEYAPISDNVGFEGSVIGAALQANPTRPVRDSKGVLLQSSDFRNPVAMLEFIDDNAETTRLLGNVNLDFKITDWLTYRFNYGLDNSGSVRRTGVSRQLNFNDVFGRGRAYLNNRYLQSRLIEHTLNFSETFGGSRLDAVAGFSYQKFENKGQFVSADFFLTDEIPQVDNIDGVNNSGSNKAFNASSDRRVDELQSYFGRVNYSLNDKYLVTATVRADGSSKFGENNKYGVFPSVAVAWRIAEEGFLPALFYDLKLRAGWGITGNQEFDGGVSRAAYQINSDGTFTRQNFPNPDIRWEETSQYNIGLDFGFFEGRLSGSVDYFTKNTTDLLVRLDAAQPSEVQYRWTNLPGEVVNTGLEFSIDGRIVNNGKFNWQVLANATFLTNEVKNLSTIIPTGTINGQGLSGAYAQSIASGQPLYAFYMRKFGGYNSEGLGIYPDGDKLFFVGDPFPDFTFGLTNNFKLNRFDLSLFIAGNFGQDIYNNTANAIFLKGNLRNGRNVSVDAANSPESPNNFGEVSTRFLEDGSFVRLSNVQLGYNFPIKGKDISSVRLYVTGQNLFVITDYSGFDPEVNTNKSLNGVPSLGIDYTPYPTARTFTLGLNVGF